MSRLILPQFKIHPPGEAAADYSVDAEDLDEAFAAVARCVNGGLDNDNIGSKFSVGTAPGAFQNAFAEPNSVTTLFGSVKVGTKAPSVRLYLGVTGGAIWRPLKASIVATKAADQGGYTCGIFVEGGATLSTVAPVAGYPANANHWLPEHVYPGAVETDTMSAAEVRDLTDSEIPPGSAIYADFANVCGPCMVLVTFKAPRIS